MKLSAVEGSLYLYLVDNLETPLGIKVFEDKNLVDFDAFTKWVVIDTLTNQLGAQPVQMYFIHIATQKGLVNAKSDLNTLVDTVEELLTEGTRMDILDPLGAVIGEMEISNTSLSPIMTHQCGGNFRSLTIEIVYSQ